jgi:hypothetical protein
MKSKVMLLSIKNIDRKIHEKFSKMGLSELVVEPIAPKTLVHKVKLLLRSLPKTQVEGETDNQTVKSMEDGTAPEAVDNGTKSDGSKYNKIDGFMASKAKDKKTELHLSDDEENKPAEESVNYHEEALAKKRKTYTEEELQDIENSSKATGVADKIDGFYRNKETSQFQLTDDESQKKAKKEAILEEEVTDKKQKSNLIAKEEIERKKTSRLDLQDENEEPDLPSSFEIDERQARAKGIDLLLQDSTEKKERAALDRDDEEEKKKKTTLNLELGIDEKSNDKKNNLEEEADTESRRKVILQLEVETKEREKKEALEKEEKTRKASLDIQPEEIQEEKNLEKTPAQFVDKYYRNNDLEKKKEDEGNENDKTSAKLKLKKEKDEGQEHDPEISEDEEVPAAKTLEKQKLSNDDENKPDKLNNLEDEDEGNEKEKIQLKLDKDEKEAEMKESTLEDDEELDTNKKTNLNLEDENKEKEAATKLEKENTEKSRKESTNLDLEKDQQNRSGNHGKVDHIETHYGMKQLDRKVDQNWDKLGDTDNVASLAEAKKRKESQARAFEFDVKKDDGFNFENAQKEFSDVDPFFRNLKNKYGSIDYENNIAIDKSGNKVPLDEALEAIIAENSKLMGTAVENIETDEIFLVSPLGITGMIEASNYYHNKKKKGSDLLKYLAQKILDDYGAATTFILYDLKAKTHKSWYCGHVELDLPQSNRGDRDKHWQTIFNEFQKEWKATIEVTINDKFLIYPLQEGITTLGIGVVEFLAPVDENKIMGIQNILSCALGLYYQEYHGTLAKKEDPKKAEQTMAKSGSGFFNKVFGFFKNKAS